MMMAGFPAARWSGALKRLIADIEAGQIDVVVVYKVDRLTRALSDSAKLVDVFDRRGVSFVSITQKFNTTLAGMQPSPKCIHKVLRRFRLAKNANPRQTRLEQSAIW